MRGSGGSSERTKTDFGRLGSGLLLDDKVVHCGIDMIPKGRYRTRVVYGIAGRSMVRTVEVIPPRSEERTAIC